MTVINDNLNTYSQVYKLIHSIFFLSKVNSAKTPKYHQAMTGPDQVEHSTAIDLDVSTLPDKMNVWDVVHCTPDMHVLPSTWDFRCKCYPDGLIKKN